MKLEVCCGSYQDVVAAQKGHADRVELNQALHMGGLTPSLGTLIQAKKDCTIPIICMVRNRGAGFCFDASEKALLFEDAKVLLEHGADGLAFGYLHEDFTIDVEETKRMVELIHSYHKEAVFHRAFDCVEDMDRAMQALIAAHVDRVLTSGGRKDVTSGKDQLAYLQKTYGNQIEILAGCGVNRDNIKELVVDCGITQVHSSCKAWKKDPTTIHNEVSYAYASSEHAYDYDVVDEQKVADLTSIIKQYK